MASITYKGGPGEPEEITWGGKTLKKGEAVDFGDNPTLLQKAKNNPMFDVSAGDEQEQRQAEVMGNYRDPLTGSEVTLVRQPPASPYLNAPVADARPAPPTAATQGSTALDAERAGTFEQTFGADPATVAKGQEAVEEVQQQRRGPGRPRKEA